MLARLLRNLYKAPGAAGGLFLQMARAPCFIPENNPDAACMYERTYFFSRFNVYEREHSTAQRRQHVERGNKKLIRKYSLSPSDVKSFHA